MVEAAHWLLDQRVERVEQVEQTHLDLVFPDKALGSSQFPLRKEQVPYSNLRSQRHWLTYSEINIIGFINT